MYVDDSITGRHTHRMSATEDDKPSLPDADGLDGRVQHLPAPLHGITSLPPTGRQYTILQSDDPAL